jgi:drug/metabolite transporter (DMT)-like permease
VNHTKKTRSLIRTIPGQTFLWLAIAIFGASSAVTRKLTEIGAQHFMGGHNPISLCNVLFVGNLCALFVLAIIHRRQLNPRTFAKFTKQEWVGLVMVAILAGALAPSLIFQALATTGVNTVVLLGRLEPPLALFFSVLFLAEQVNLWEIAGAIIAFLGVTLSIVLQPSTVGMIAMGGFYSGIGELLAAAGALALATATIIGKKRLSRVPLGFYSIFRTALGTLVFFVAALVLYGSNHFMDAFSPFLWQWMLVYGALIVAAGQSFWIAGLRASTVSMASWVASFTPIIGILAAYLVLGEVPSQAQYLGGSIILVGIVLSQIGTQRKGFAKVRMSNTNSNSIEQTLETRIGFKGI